MKQVKLDIQVSQDGKVLAIHDPDTLRTAKEKYIIAETNYSDLQHLNVGVGGKGGSKEFNERIPLLSEVIEQIPSGKLIQIEIKHQITNMEAVIAEFAQLRKDIAVQIISYDPRKIRQVKQMLPHLDCFLVMDEKDPPIDDRIQFALDNQLTGLDMDYKMATPEFVAEVLHNNLQVAHWTVNTVDDAKRVIEQGATFIASDFADEIKEAMSKE